MKSGGLFAGYGGLDMAVAEVFGAEPAWFSEIDEAPSKILAHHWPDVPNHGDITKIDWSTVEPVDVLVGGFPCQDVSLAGKRAGMKPDTRSGLWTHMAYAIEQLRPRYVVAENVRGLLSAEAHSDVELCPWCLGDGPTEPVLRALGAVLGDLGELGYDTRWCGLRAADIGAPHGRYRVFVLAWDAADQQQEWPQSGGDRALAADATSERHRDTWPASIGGIPATAVAGATAHTQSNGRDEGWPEPAGKLRGPDAPECSSSPVAWGGYRPAIERWERILGRLAPAPTESSSKGSQRLSPRFVEWMMGLPAGHVTDVPGVNRNAQLKALGNGVVPQQAIAALRHMLGDREVPA